jgi:hypothetical protein
MQSWDTPCCEKKRIIHVQQDYGSPEKLGDLFRSWDSTWRQSPAPLTLVTRKWIDLVEVQEVVFGLPQDQMMMFFMESISSDANMRSCLKNLRDDISWKRIGIDSMVDSQVLAIQAQFPISDLSWFVSVTPCAKPCMTS